MAAHESTTQRPDAPQLSVPTPTEPEEIFPTRFLTMCNHRPISKSQKEPEPRLPPMAYLRIRGRWLNRAGFVGGTRVRISVSQGRLVFEAVGPAYPPQRRRPLPRPMAEENRIVGNL